MGLLGLAALSVPSASATILPPECTAVLPILDYDAVTCATETYGVASDVTAGVLDVVAEQACPVERIVYDDILGGPFTGQPCVDFPIEL